jgi:hypothetical protein
VPLVKNEDLQHAGRGRDQVLAGELEPRHQHLGHGAAGQQDAGRVGDGPLAIGVTLLAGVALVGDRLPPVAGPIEEEPAPPIRCVPARQAILSR